MKILYVNPGRLEAGLDAIIKGPPLALITIAAMVPEHEAEVFDFKVDRYSEKNFRKKLSSAEVVAISSMTPQISHALEVAQMAKEEGAITILGGYHPTLEPNFCISQQQVDYIVRGEGEHTFKELIDFISNNRLAKKISEIDGISYKEPSGNIIHNQERALEPNLDNFPLPKYELLDKKKYLYLGTHVALMETSRGCPHNCSFCCIIKMWRNDGNSKTYRTKSIKRIFQEIYSLDLDKWDFIFFNDDNFTINVKRTRKILDLLIKSKLHNKVYFSCQSRVDTLYRNPDIAEKMAKAGFKNIFLGIESVHQESLDAMNKHSNIEMIRNAVEQCHKYGISIFGGMIIGFPGETIEMVRENIEFAKSLELDFVQFTPITAFPGTDFFKENEKKGMISTYDWKYYNLFHSMMKTETLSRNEMYELVSEAYGKYYVSKQYIKMMAKRAFLLEQYSWFREFGFTWVNQFIFGGYKMLKSMGMGSSDVR